MPGPVVLGIALFSIVVSLLGGSGSASRRPVEEAGASRCPLIYQPVICDGGKIYSNLCYAERHHAKNCIPYGL